MSTAEQSTRPSLRTFRRRNPDEAPFACLTAYDALTAGHLAQAGIPLLLVGDSLAQVALGYPDTTHVPLDIMVALTAAVRRGAPNVFVMADLPFLAALTEEDALRAAARFVTEGGADAVKIEMDDSRTGWVQSLANAGIATVPHLGCRPQHVKKDGGYLVAGKTEVDRQQLASTAKNMEAAGAVMLLLEAATPEAAKAIRAVTSIPLIGCGAGPDCDGQIVVTADLLGLTPRQPSFAPPNVDGKSPLHAMAQTWISQVCSREAGGDYQTTDTGEST